MYRNTSMKSFKRQLNLLSSSTHSSSDDRRKIDYIGIAFFSGISLGALGLGIWQWNRYNEKVNMIETAKHQFHGQMLSFPRSYTTEQLNDWMKSNYGRKVSLEGKFDHSKEVMLGLRPATSSSAQGMGTNPQGYYVIVPFYLSDGQEVFVNRGWIPRTIATYPRPENTIKINAIVSKPEKKGIFSPKNKPESRNLLWLEGGSLLQATNGKTKETEPLIFDLIGDETSTYPLPKDESEFQSYSITPLTHLTYSITW